MAGGHCTRATAGHSLSVKEQSFSGDFPEVPYTNGAIDRIESP